MSNNKILTAQDIDGNRKSIETQIEKNIIEFNKLRIKKKIKEIKDIRKHEQKLESETITELLTKEDIINLRNKYFTDNETASFREQQKEQLQLKKENYFIMRQTIQDLNELNEFSAEIERNNIQTIDNFLPFNEVIQKSVATSGTFQKIEQIRKDNINEYIQLYSDKSLSFKSDPIQILLNMRELYSIDKTIDDIDLYEKFEMESNIDMSNKLADICFQKYSNNEKSDNIINEFSKNINNPLEKFVSNQIINNKMLGLLLLSSMNNSRTSFITNNSVTCLKTMYSTTANNQYIYNTRTLGELLYEITNDENRDIDKQYKQQIYLTYDGSRPSSEEYYKWNGLQVFDIDLKYWNGNFDLLKKKMFEYLHDFHWFLWICKSASGKGIHIYTKVSPPHHVYVDSKENEYISKYWFNVNYAHKSSVIYDILYRLNKDRSSNINFPNNYFNEDSNFFELTNKVIIDGDTKLIGVDNTVARITSGIRLTYDEKPIVNPNFLDLHVGLGLTQTLDGHNYQKTIKEVLLRESTYHSKLILKINVDLMVVNINDIKDNKPSDIDLSKFITLGGDISNLLPIARSAINYNMRYNVCNTLAALFGKDGLPIAHTLLDSYGCKNVGEINSFYSCAISNGKKPSKFGLDILKKNGIIKTIEPEVKEIITNNFKNTIRKAIENALDNKLNHQNIELGDYEFLSDKKDILLNPAKGGITGSKINIIFSPPGTGKCLGKNTPVLMFDCTTKMIQDIKVGDKLMGLNSTPRTVLSTCIGQEEMFRIIPEKGEPWECNKSHILSVVESGIYNSDFGKIPNNYDIQDINISKMLTYSKNHRKKLFRVPLNFEHNDVLISPYFLGLWLGDGHSSRTSVAVGDIDKDITVPFLNAYAKKLDCKLTRYEDFRDGHNVSEYSIVRDDNVSNKLLDLMKYYDILNNKHIPKDYLINDRKTRLMVFAGLIDSDGGGADGTYDYVTKLPQLRDDIIFLCRSLGYNVNSKEKIVDEKIYHRILISGNFEDVPVRLIRKKFKRNINKNPLVTGFKIESIGIGDYYGFEIDGDKRFMLGDFTVTHNTEFIKTLARDGKRILLVLPYISVIKNKIETDETIMTMFDCYYGTKDIKQIEYGINAVTTFDKFARSNYDKLSKMFDFIFIDESHLLFTSAYRIEATSNVIKKIKELFFISSNDPFAAKLCLLTGTETGESYFFSSVANIIRVNKKSLNKTMEFLICDDLLDSVTRLASESYNLLSEGYRLLIPTNKGEIYSEKLIGMIEYLLGRPLRYGYYKRSNTEQEICKLINDHNTVGDYEVIFCSNYLSVGVDINDRVKFASIYLGPFSGYEIEQFNARIRKSGIKSVCCIQTQKADGTTNDLLLEEPNLLLRITEEDRDNFIDDKAIASAKQDFIAQYDPVLHKIVTPGFSYFNGKIRFNLEEYELMSFENKYNECMQHPVKVARELNKYGYKIHVSTEFEGLDLVKQEELKQIGIKSAKDEKLRKHTLLVGTYIDLVQKNTYINSSGLEFNDIIGWIGKHPDSVIEDRSIENFVNIRFDVFASPIEVTVKSKEALDLMYRPAKYLISKYSVTKAVDIINQYIDDNGILKQKLFKRAINLLKLVDSSDANELTEPMTNMLEKMYDFVDDFELKKDHKISYNTYNSKIDEWSNSYIDQLGIKINTTYGFDKIKDSLLEMLADIATKTTSKNGIRFSYNKLPDQDSSTVLNRKSVDSMIQRMFQITSEVIQSDKNVRQKHIILVAQDF